jgi:hypothetical protein
MAWDLFGNLGHGEGLRPRDAVDLPLVTRCGQEHKAGFRDVLDIYTNNSGVRERKKQRALIGSLRRECLDHVIVLGERHLRRLLTAYLAYYHGARTHLSLEKDAPRTRPVQMPTEGE